MSTEEILNAGNDGAETDAITSAAQSRLKSFVERFDRLLDDAETIRIDIKEVGLEAKGEGFDVKILKRVVIARRKDPTKRQEEEALFDLYASAIGGLG
ncbi:DUF2312 domain-containing protein [Asticcacaulis sp. LKC15W]|uniref:DUF2312 domain-containing protein n=2 Tax=Asticcacaulis machinosus TaxID=2984211 RepID=A0ABT5HGL8_9CAUL|nr:GapR family DNA-binding domain-containing protein [Asticcacaulis machinosus]MDC7675404.1 DUF2312 domain-containing protein [Asticcacaulis machinosus]